MARSPSRWRPPAPLPEREADFQRKVVKLARDLGWCVRHERVSVWAVPGWPDLFCLRPRDGRVLALELKGTGGTLTAAQTAYLETLNACGILAVAAWPEDWDWLVELLR